MYESSPWKEDLKRRRQLLLQYNTKEHFEKDEDKAYTVIEKAIFYSAFIIRKLLDCNGKMSDEADQYAGLSGAEDPAQVCRLAHHCGADRP